MNSNNKKVFDIMNASDHKDNYGTRIYHIRTYQRGYRWGIQQINSLLNDIYINYKKYHNNLSPDKSTGYEYCIQTLVVKEEKDNDNKKVYSVIDGQQRLTTLGLLFRALNALDKNVDEKQDRIDIEYDRNKNNYLINDISDKCRKIGEIDISGVSLERLYSIFDENPKNADEKNDSFFKEINSVLNEASTSSILDERFMINAYSYLYLFFKIILNQENSEDSYFWFLGNETNIQKDYYKDRLLQLRNMFKYYTTVIWYEPLKNRENGDKEEDIFENFNSRKIPLTKSELVKALFMNPDNYIKEGKKDYNSEAIKTKQIMIGIQWDEIEKQLHNSEMWHFFPHLDVWHSQTRFDAIIDYFVYKEYRVRHPEVNKERYKIRNLYEADALFAFKQLEEWIKNDLKNAKESSEKAAVMKKWWDDICTVYEDYYVFLQPDKKMTRLFHRLSLIEWIDRSYFKKVTNGSNVEEYFSSIDNNIAIFEELSKTLNDKKIEVINEKIVERINRCFQNATITEVYQCEEFCVVKEKCASVTQKIKALVFDPRKNVLLIEAFLIIFSLDILENNNGAVSRFSFYEYFKKEKTKNKEDWIFEHIMARGTSLKEWKSKESHEKKEFINTIIDSGWEEYTRYKFEDVLDGKIIEEIINRKQEMVSLLKAAADSDPIDDTIFDTLEGYEADQLNSKEDNSYKGLIMELLKDNSMGNMAILTRGDNSAVGNSTFEDKKSKIIEKVNNGSFVPMASVNVFMGTYCEKGFSADMWYPCHRKNYLESMIKAINHYLGTTREG